MHWEIARLSRQLKKKVLDEAAARQLFDLVGGSARERGVVPRVGEVP
jgi:hypothetical protein